MTETKRATKADKGGADSGASEDEQAKITERERLSAVTVFKIIRSEGEDEMHRPGMSLWWSGVAAGLAILGVQALRRHAVATGGLTLLVALAAIVGIVATALAMDAGSFLGVGLGIWERISLWPLPIWLAAVGVGHLWALTAARPPQGTPLTMSVRVPAARSAH